MGYDFKTEEDGYLVIELVEYDTGKVVNNFAVKVKKDTKFYVDYGGVKLHWR